MYNLFVIVINCVIYSTYYVKILTYFYSSKFIGFRIAVISKPVISYDLRVSIKHWMRQQCLVVLADMDFQSSFLT
jgi:hypothetical protein